MSHAPIMDTRPLLVELLTEELPPKALLNLGQAIARGLQTALDKQHLLAPDCTVEHFATPRRLAVRLGAVRQQAPDQTFTEKLMPVKVGLSADGQPTPALTKKLASKGLEHLRPDDLIRESDGKQDYLYARGTAKGAVLTHALQPALEQAIANLPIPKVMQYQLEDGVSTVKFVRPAHGLLALWGKQVVPAQVLGLQAQHMTWGHRFMGNHPITIEDAADYEERLLVDGRVVASFEKRRDSIAALLEDHSQALDATLGDDPEVAALLDEVTALVEYPAVYVGEFDEQFLEVPPECLILTMRLNQKYFPLFEPGTGKLLPRFLIVSNMQVSDPANIIQGNERVVRPRLADAQFFFDTDRKVALEERVPQLADSVYHNRLGSQLDRIQRVRRIATHLAAQLGADPELADRAALLAKADLNSNMVGEFPELQGIMGAYYAQADGEAPAVVEAIRNQYRIRLDAPVNAESLVAAILFIAERAETLVGIWGIGLAPTGERDPYGLRRAALGIISAFEQLAAGGFLAIPAAEGPDLAGLLNFAASTFPEGVLKEDTVNEVIEFVYERYRNQLLGEHDRNVVDAVLALFPPLHEVHARIAACAHFAEQSASVSLAAANKRIGNLLRKAEGDSGTLDASRLTEPAEQALAQAIEQLKPLAQQQFNQGDFTASLATLAQAREPVDAFFDDVMVMAEDPAVRANRLALLAELHRMMNRVADLSRLAQ